MKNLRPDTLGILQRVETLSGSPVEFKPDSSLTLRATLQIARNGAAAHTLRYRPSGDPIDYWVVYQAGFALRLFELPPAERFDFMGTGDGATQVETLVKTGQPLSDADQSKLPEFAQMIVHWALMNLRSYAIGMRIDQWIATEYPGLSEMQAVGVDNIQQENLRLLSMRVGTLTVPIPLLAPVAASALFADRLFEKSLYAIPYKAAGVVATGQDLLRIYDNIAAGPGHDRELVDAWSDAIGLTGWYDWTPYKA